MRLFSKVCIMSQNRPFLWKSYWKQLGWTCRWDGVGSQGITGGGEPPDRGNSDMVQACRLCGGRPELRNNGLGQQFCVEQSCPPTLAPKPNNSGPSHMSWHHSSCCPAMEFRVSEFESVCLGPLRILGTFSASVSLSHHLHWFSRLEVMKLLFLAPEPWAGEPGGAGTPHSSGAPAKPRHPSETEPLPVGVGPPSLNAASFSLYSQGFCAVRLQAVL